jgi:23S rRNA (guanosine2251-2'-O)-methyltransferase
MRPEKNRGPQKKRGPFDHGRPPKHGNSQRRDHRARPARPVSQGEVLYGVHPVLEMLRAGRRHCSAIWMARGQEQAPMAEVQAMAEKRGIVIQRATADQLEDRCGDGRHQGVIADVSAFPYSELDTISPPTPDEKRPAPFLLALDSISDPQNFGAILRTAQCTGAEAVLLPKDRSVRPIPTVSKASAGALEHTRLIQVTNLANSLDELKAGGFWVAGTDANNGNSLFDNDLTGPLVIVIGSEGKGMRPLVRQRCDYLLAIPQVGRIGSLNASAAAAVVLYEVFRQRNRAGSGAG